MRVRLIFASWAGSIIILSAFALALVKKVPVVKKRSVRALRLGVWVAAVLNIVGTGYRVYAAVAVRTTRNVRRGFESDR